MADGAVAGDPLRQVDAVVGVLALEEPLDALVDEPQTRLHLQDRLAHHREAEVAGLDEPGMHRADGDLVDARALHLDERVRAGVVHHGGRGTRVVAHRVPALGPVLVQHQASQERVADGDDAEQVVHLALEPAGREREVRQRGDLGSSAIDLDAPARCGGREDRT